MTSYDEYGSWPIRYQSWSATPPLFCRSWTWAEPFASSLSVPEFPSLPDRSQTSIARADAGASAARHKSPAMLSLLILTPP